MDSKETARTDELPEQPAVGLKSFGTQNKDKSKVKEFRGSFLCWVYI